MPDSVGGHPALKRPASSTFGHDFPSSKEGRDATRRRAGDLKVKRYHASDKPGRSSWRKTEDLVADCDKVLEVAKKGSLRMLFEKQFDKQRGLAS